MAAENVVEFTDLPVKRPREEEEGTNGVSNDAVSALPNDPQYPGISAVIPGWFSEISPMWPG